MLLALRWRTWRGLPLTVLAAVFAAGLAFAAHFAVTKFLYDSTDGFVAVFAYSRLAVGWWALLGWLALLLSARLFDGGQFLPRRQRLQARRRGYRLPIIFFMSKGVGAVALLLQNYAISLGSVSLVNALQGTQYVFLLLLAALISWHWPHLFHEELQRNTLGQKIAGISLVGIGLVFITL